MTIGSNYVGSLSDSWDNSARNKVSRRQHLQQCDLIHIASSLLLVVSTV